MIANMLSFVNKINYNINKASNCGQQSITEFRLSLKNTRIVFPNLLSYQNIVKPVSPTPILARNIKKSRTNPYNTSNDALLYM